MRASTRFDPGRHAEILDRFAGGAHEQTRSARTGAIAEIHDV
jgi:hypothetical protein